MILPEVQQFADKVVGKPIDFDKKYGMQCVDLFNLFVQDVLKGPWIGTPVTGGARDLAEVSSEARNKTFKVLPPDTKTQSGDVNIYGAPNGRYIENGVQKFFGHCDIELGDGRVIQQNAKNQPFCTVDNFRAGGKIAVLRPLKFIGQGSPENVQKPPQNQNKHKIVAGDTFWGLEEKYNIAHGTLQKLNPGIDAKALQIGSEIVIGGEPPAAPSTPETFYTIRSGDTFWGLENAWQLPHGTLQNLNPGANPRALPIGQRIRRS